MVNCRRFSSVFDHFVGLTLKWLISAKACTSDFTPLHSISSIKRINEQQNRKAFYELYVLYTISLIWELSITVFILLPIIWHENCACFSLIWDCSFRTFPKLPEKLTLCIYWYALVRKVYQGVRNISFSENFVNVLNEWSLLHSAAHLRYHFLCCEINIGNLGFLR